MAELLESVDLPPREPTSAVQALREAAGKGQLRSANEAGVSQGHLSLVESGAKPLTHEVALKMAPVLGVDVVELEAAEAIARLHRAALKQEVDASALLYAIEDLNSTLPDSDVSESLIEALLGVLKLALQHYDEHEKAAAKVSTKSRALGRTRDGLGRRVVKPYGGR
ncbi:MAG: helix-turn-helix domain-containing protein [Actinomycetota bacterium]|nr:helix-turn-helix domain-containing protein [Actinomycetota bacterium]